MYNSVALFDRLGFDDSFLASPSEIVALLAQVAGQRSRRPQVLRVLVEECLSRHPGATGQIQRAALRKINLHESAVDVRQSAVAAQARVDLSLVRRRKHCKCGHCRWCLDNARWDQIFSEKYAAPGYYRLKVRHNSSLAGAC
jgi:hypothetical protein